MLYKQIGSLCMSSKTFKEVGYSRTKCINCEDTVEITNYITGKSNKSYSKITKGCKCGSFPLTQDKEENGDFPPTN